MRSQFCLNLVHLSWSPGYLSTYYIQHVLHAIIIFSPMSTEAKAIKALNMIYISTGTCITGTLDTIVYFFKYNLKLYTLYIIFQLIILHI